MLESGKRKMNFLPSLAHLKLHEGAATEMKRNDSEERLLRLAEFETGRKRPLVNRDPPPPPPQHLVIHPNRHIVLYTGVNSEEQEEAMRNFLRAIADEVDSPAGEEEYVINSEKLGIYVGKGLEPGDIDEVSSFPEMIRRLRLYLNGMVPADFRSSMLAQVYAGEPLYGFSTDDTRPALPLLKSYDNVLVERSYQTKVMERFFPFEGIARSGIGVVPCGAGKTAIGILATLKMRRSTIVFCPDKLSVDQWYKEFVKWTQIPAASASRIQKYSENRDVVVINPLVSTVLITTYSLMAGTGTSATRDAIGEHEWGLAILDEVHKGATPTAVLATMTRTKSACKIGLTATFVRAEISELYQIIDQVGPIVVDIPLKDLQDGGHIAKVNVIKYDIPMPAQWKQAYDADVDVERKKRVRTLFPDMIRKCKTLMRYHEEKGHRVLIFIEEVGTLHEYSRILNRDYIDGKIETEEQVRLVARMNEGGINEYRTLLFNSIGDASLDIPNADVIIEISRMGSSQRQAGQRAGRVQRAKCGFNEGMYYIVYPSNSDSEVGFVNARCDYLRTMGYLITETKDPLAQAKTAARAAQQAGNRQDPEYLALGWAIKSVKTLLVTGSPDVQVLFEWVTDGTRSPTAYPVPWRTRQLPQGRG